MKVLIAYVLVLATGVLSAKTRARGRILGGEEADLSDFKYQALIVVPNFENSTQKVYCGGSVINNRWILTAAHCFDDGNLNGTRILLGLTNDNGYSYRTNATDVIIHEEYYRDYFDVINDIALIQIPFVQFNEYIQLIPLSNVSSLDNKTITVSGVGLLNSTTVANRMQYSMLNVLTSTECERVFKELPTTQFCTFSFLNIACAGDSGGPGVEGYGGHARLVGVVSHGSSFCAPNSTTVYTRTYSYLSWMRNKTQLRLNPNWRY